MLLLIPLGVLLLAGAYQPARSTLGERGPAAEARVNWPWSVAVGADGSLYIADTGNSRVRKVDPAGVITTLAGNGKKAYSGDGGPATWAAVRPTAVALGAGGTFYIADAGNNRVRRVDADGVITTFAGNGEAGYSGDGGPAIEASLHDPTDVAMGADGSLYIADTLNNRVRKVDTAGVIATVAGDGREAYAHDGGPATEAALHWPEGVAVAPGGTLYIADRGNERVRKVDPAGVITTVAGTGRAGYTDDGALAADGPLDHPSDVALGADGALYIADTWNYRIRKVDDDGVITTVAGDGWKDERGFGRYAGDGGPATEASFNWPYSVAVGADGSLYIADMNNHRIRKVDPQGIITTVAGTGE
jgi:sugar lactone lactonase YvrE